MKAISLALLALTGLAAGCTTTGNIERNAGAGAAIGAIAGAVVGNNVGDGDAGQGAVIGAVAGGALGAARGYSLDQRRTECRATSHAQTYRDANGAYYYEVPGTNRTCWSSDESPRSQ